MQIRKLIFYLSVALVLNNANAQDRLYKRDGSIEEVKIKEVGTRTIIYKKWSNIEGPDFVILKNEIERIKFQNGDEENFGRYGAETRAIKERRISGTRYGNNILSFSPVHMTNTSAVGFGLSYERVLDKNNILSFYFPIVYSFKNNNDYYDPSVSSYTNNKSTMLWVYPGIKIYPTGNNGVVRYSVGPCLAFGSGSRNYANSVFDPVSNSYIIVQHEESVFVMGLLVNNSLNIQPTPKLHLGLELGIGIPYYTDEKNNNSYYYNLYKDLPLVQFNFNIGYRF